MKLATWPLKLRRGTLAQTKREAMMCRSDDGLASFGIDILENSAFLEYEGDI